MRSVERQSYVARDDRGARRLADSLGGPEGFRVMAGLDAAELERMQAFIEAQWLACLAAHAPSHAGEFRSRGIARYHELSHLVDHGTLWPKRARILPAEAVAALRATRLFRMLEDELGPLRISNEENVEREEITWRLVRPDEAGDTGPVHADRWFWDLGHGTSPAGVQRVKVWVAVVTEPGVSGLQLLPGSHLREWRYHGEPRSGFVKPCIDEDVGALGLELIATEPGDAIVFNDRLLHGGGASRGRFTRVSFELTLFVGGRGA